MDKLVEKISYVVHFIAYAIGGHVVSVLLLASIVTAIYYAVDFMKRIASK